MGDIRERILAQASELKDEIIRLRRHFHMNPELSFSEDETSSFICRWLKKEGIDYETGMSGTAIIATIKGNGKGKKIIALRAEMDALPIIEKNSESYASTCRGKMHACGHDGHMAMLLGTALIINGMRDHFGGTVKLIFQPGEEKSPGGARLLIESGAFNNQKPDMIIAQHVLPELETGKIGYKAGSYMASCDEIYITVKGKGGHAALPGNSTDQIYIASKLVVNLREEMARQISINQIPTVLGIGRISGEGATNVIPEKVEIAGTFRTFDENWRAEGLALVKKIADATVAAFGIEAEVRIAEGYPVLINNEDLTAKAMEFTGELIGSDRIETFGHRMSSDDFSFYSAVAPSLYYRVGIRKPGAEIRKLHTADFDIDENGLQTGVANLTWLVYRFMAE